MSVKRLYKNCRIYTMDDNNPVCQAMVTDGNKIVYAGNFLDAQTIAGNDAKTIDLDGNVILPAFCDAHVHAPGLAYDILFNINLYPAINEKETMDIIKKHISSHPEKEMYYGRGFNVNFFSGDEGIIGPRKERLDEICADKPIIISDFGGNCMWMNTSALAKYDITPDRVCPAGGEIVIDPKNGELWGIIRNEARGFVPYQEFTDEENYRAMKFFQDTLLSKGYTSVFALRPPGTVEPRTTLFEAFRVLENRGELKLRIHGARDMDPSGDIDAQLEEMLRTKEKVETPLMQFTTAKFFLDGVIEGLDGYLLEPYSEAAGKGSNFTSCLFWDKEKLAEAFEKCMEKGFQIHCHSIGDGATHDALDAMEEALKKVKPGDYRNTLTHLQLVDEYDKQRMADMNVIATVQPYWHFKSPAMFGLEKELLGERAETEYPLSSLKSKGIILVSSSDYPVTPNPYPFCAIEAGVTRNLINATDLGVQDITDMDDERYLLCKDERISVTDMIKSFTCNAAYGRFTEDIIGTIEENKLADFIVIDKDPYQINPVDIEKIKIVSTYFDGEKVYG